MSGAGTVALIFVTLANLPSAGMPASYNRYVIPAGPDELVDEPHSVNSRFFWAQQKMGVSLNLSGILETGSRAASPMKNTIAGCHNYARENIPLFEEVAEHWGIVIRDYRCVFVPNGYKLTSYASNRYDMSDIKDIRPTNPYKLEKMPEPERHTGPACLYMHPEYPAEAEEDSVEGEVTAECDNIRGIDGYYRAKNCHVVKLVVKGDDGKELPKDVGFEQSALNFFEQGGGCRQSPSRIYHVNFTLIGDDD